VTQQRYAALAGFAAAAVAVGVGEVMAATVAPRSGPLVAVGGAVVDNVPERVKELAIQLFGTDDKLALQVGIVVVLCGFAAVLGLASLRRVWVGLVGVAAFGAVGMVAALTRTGATAVWVLPSVVAAGAAALVLWLLLRRLVRAEAPGTLVSAAADTPVPAASAGTPVPPTADTVVPVGADTLVPAKPAGTPQAAQVMPRADRRRFLGAVAVAVGGAAVAGYVGRSLGESTNVNAARSAIALPTPSGRLATSPPGADVADLMYTTPNDVFYRIDIALVTPRIDPSAWRLKIHGRVRNPMTLTFDDLLARPMIERYVTLSCVSNEVGGDLVGNAKWLGVPVKDLLDEAGVDEGADQVVSRSVDGFTAGTPTKALTDGRDAMIAIAMNGEPLPVAHGFPARMVVPGLYGYVSATKWLAELELTTFADYDAYWIPRGWAQQAPIKTQSRIDRPLPGTIKAGRVVIAGVAWAPHRGISKVEVQVDSGPWQVATLAAVASIDTWRLWSLPWDAAPGEHTLRVRATDNAGDTQTEAQADPAPDGATGWHAIGVSVE